MYRNTKMLRSVDGPIELPWVSGDNDADRGASCWLYAVEAEGPIVEYVLAPVHRERWRENYQVKFTARNRPGVLAAVTQLLKETQINVLNANGVRSGGLFQVHMTVDCRGYQSSIDGELENRVFHDRIQMPHLQMLMEACLIDHLDFFGGNPCLSITRNETLWKLHHQVAKCHLNLDHGRQLQVEGGGVLLPLDLERSARLRLAMRYQVCPKTLRRPIYAATVDDSGTVVCLLITYEELGVLKLRATFPNSPSGPAVFTEWLREHDYDVILYKQLSAPEDQRKSAVVVVRDLRATHEHTGEAAWIRFKQEVLQLPPELQNVQFKGIRGRRNGKDDERTRRARTH